MSRNEIGAGMDEAERKHRAATAPKPVPWEGMPQGVERTQEIMRWVNLLVTWISGTERFKRQEQVNLGNVPYEMSDEEREKWAEYFFHDKTGAELPPHVRTMVMESLDETRAVREMSQEDWDDLDAQFDEWVQTTYRKPNKKKK